jgi:hypothetical protein
MTFLPQPVNDMIAHPERLLAIVGGAAIGGFGLAWLVQMAVRGWTRQEVPRWAVMTLRVGGGVVAGWLVALMLYHGSGSGGGGGGWFGLGGDGDKKNEESAKDKEKTPKDSDVTQSVLTMEIEVLGTGDESPRRYRIRKKENDGPLLTRQEAVDAVKKRAAQEPTLKSVVIRLYEDSPAPDNAWVEQLRQEVGVLTTPDGKRLDVSVPEPRKEKAPRK